MKFFKFLKYKQTLEVLLKFSILSCNENNIIQSPIRRSSTKENSRKRNCALLKLSRFWTDTWLRSTSQMLSVILPMKDHVVLSTELRAFKAMNFIYNLFCSIPHWKLIQTQLWISCIYAYRSQSIWFQDQGLIEVAESGCGHGNRT